MIKVMTTKNNQKTFRKMPLVIPLKQTVDQDLSRPVTSFLRNTFGELGSDAAQEMARQFDNQRRVACIKALDKTETSLMVLMKYHDQLGKIQGKIPFTEQARIETIPLKFIIFCLNSRN